MQHGVELTGINVSYRPGFRQSFYDQRPKHAGHKSNG